MPPMKCVRYSNKIVRKLTGLLLGISSRHGGIIVVFFLMTVCVIVLCASAANSPASALAKYYSRFAHSSPKEHANLMGNCASCHRRRDSFIEPTFPLHKDCTGCHIVQFTTVDNSATVNPICIICHTAEGLNSSRPPLKNFSRLASFTVEFD